MKMHWVTVLLLALLACTAYEAACQAHAIWHERQLLVQACEEHALVEHPLYRDSCTALAQQHQGPVVLCLSEWRRVWQNLGWHWRALALASSLWHCWWAWHYGKRKVRHWIDEWKKGRTTIVLK